MGLGQVIPYLRGGPRSKDNTSHAYASKEDITPSHSVKQNLSFFHFLSQANLTYANHTKQKGFVTLTKLFFIKGVTKLLLLRILLSPNTNFDYYKLYSTSPLTNVDLSSQPNLNLAFLITKQPKQASLLI